MPRYTKEEIEDGRRQLYLEFVLKFDQQPATNRIRRQEDLLISDQNISPPTLSRAFKNARSLQNADNPAPAIAACITVHNFLAANWRVDPDGTFRYIGKSTPPKEDGKLLLHERFPRLEINKALEHYDKEIRIIDTYPSFLFNDQENSDEINFLDWAQKSGRKIKLLVLDPSGHGIELRMQAAVSKPQLFGMPISAFRTALVAAYKRLLFFSKDNPELLEVKLMNEFPAMHGIILQNLAFFGLHFSHRLAQQASFIEVRGLNSMYKDMVQHFEKIWNDPNSAGKLNQWSFDKLSKILEQKNNSWEPLVGRWEVYFQDKWKEDLKSQLSKISRAVLEVDPAYNSGPMSARLLFQDAEQEKIHTFDGTVRFERLKEGEFAFLVFSDHEFISIRLIIRCKLLEDDMNFLLGHWVLTNAMDLNTSAIIMFRADKKSYPLPGYNIPFEQIKIESVLQNLAFRNQNSLSLNELANQNKQLNEKDEIGAFEGHYLMYAYALGREKGSRRLKKGIQLNNLELTRYGFVRYKSIKAAAFGKAFVKRDNLYITLVDNHRDYRVGYFIFHTKDRIVETEGVYAGVFVGISYRDGFPIGRRVILVKSDQDYNDSQPDHIVANSKEFKKLNMGLVKALSGRIKNLIGFLRSNGGIFTMDELLEEWERSVTFEELEFLDFAIYFAQQNDKNKAISLLERAVEFGFYDLKVFEDKINPFECFNDIIEDPRYIAIKDKLDMND